MSLLHLHQQLVGRGALERNRLVGVQFTARRRQRLADRPDDDRREAQGVVPPDVVVCAWRSEAQRVSAERRLVRVLEGQEETANEDRGDAESYVSYGPVGSENERNGAHGSVSAVTSLVCTNGAVICGQIEQCTQ